MVELYHEFAFHGLYHNYHNNNYYYRFQLSTSCTSKCAHRYRDINDGFIAIILNLKSISEGTFFVCCTLLH